MGTNKIAAIKSDPPPAGPVGLATGVEKPNLDNPELYLNREMTWLEFNKRVLNEVTDRSNPPLERMKFCAIFASNLDEFFMKRIGGLKLQAAAGLTELTVDGRSPQQQIDQCCELVTGIETERDTVLPELLDQLQQHGIRILDYQDLSAQQQQALRDHYLENIFPLVFEYPSDPRLIRRSRPFAGASQGSRRNRYPPLHSRGR